MIYYYHHFLDEDTDAEMSRKGSQYVAVLMIIPSTFGSRIYVCPVTLHCLESSDSLKHLSQDVAMGSVATLLSSVKKGNTAIQGERSLKYSKGENR